MEVKLSFSQSETLLLLSFFFSEGDNSFFGRLVQLRSVKPGSGTENYPPLTSNSHEFGPPTHARVNCGKVVHSDLYRCAVLKIARSKGGSVRGQS